MYSAIYDDTDRRYRITGESFNKPRSDIEDAIDEWIFNEKYRMILKRRLLDGVRYNELAEEFDMSVRQIKNIVYQCEKTVFEHM